MNMAVISSSDLSMHVHRCVYLHTCMFIYHTLRQKERRGGGGKGRGGMGKEQGEEDRATTKELLS